MRFKSIFAVLVWAGLLLGFEDVSDVSFSARSMGLGVSHASLSDDAFGFILNPSLPARWLRPGLGISAVLPPYDGGMYSVLSYVQPVPKLGSVGGSFFYVSNVAGDFAFRITDTRFFVAIPLGKHFNVGASIGSYGERELETFPEPYVLGPIVSLGTTVKLSTFTLGISGSHLFDSLAVFYNTPLGPTHLRGGLTWAPRFKKSSIFSSPLLTTTLEVSSYCSGSLIISTTGGEIYLLKNHLGIRAGVQKIFCLNDGNQSAPDLTFGISLRTCRIEKTDFELNYGGVFKNNIFGRGLIHQLDLVVRPGNARKAERDSMLAAQAERARRLREEALERERDRLRAELQNVQNEREALERQRQDIARMRKEALEKLSRIAGVGVQDTDSLITVTLSERALDFDSTSVDIPFPRGYKVLSGVAAFLVNYPNNRIVVQVHTDNSPLPEAYRDSRALTSARAEVIKRYFVEVEGVSEGRITVRGLGDTKPLADNDTEEGRAQNRRVEIVVIK